MIGRGSMFLSGLTVLATVLYGCQAPITNAETVNVANPGETIVHSPTQDAIQVGDNRGKIDDIRYIRKTYYGRAYRANFSLNRIPMNVMNISIVTSSVADPSRSLEFSCISNLYINDRKVGLIRNGNQVFNVDLGILKPGSNELAMVSESCKDASGAGVGGIDDFLVTSIIISTS